MSDITIRPITETDLEAYREMRLEALRLYPQAFGSDYQESAERGMDTWVSRIRMTTEGKQRMLVAEHEGELIGMIVVAPFEGVKMKHAAGLYSVYVRPGWHGRGVSDRLMEEGIRWASEQGIRLLKLGVATNNVPAIRCYQRAGFVVYGIDPEVIQVDGRLIDEFLMVRRIS